MTKNNVLLEQLKTEKYDVGITEYYDHCISGLFHHVGIPVKVMASAVTVYWENLHPFGIPSFSSYDFSGIFLEMLDCLLNFLRRNTHFLIHVRFLAIII